MQRILYVAILLIFSCKETTEPQDCAGVAGGTAVEDECGVCNGDGCVYIANVVSTPTSSESVTLKNSYNDTVDISGWTLGDKNDPNSYNIPQSTTLAYDATITFSHTTLTFQINDSGEILYLKYGTGTTIDIWP